MSTFVTPSAKSHERVTGRWMRDIEVVSHKDRFVYYAKVAFGTPIAMLLVVLSACLFFSRAGLEFSAWAITLLTFIYIGADRLARTKEFKFFLIGSDLFILGFAFVGILGAVTSDSLEISIDTLGDIRWLVLLYGLTYCWELFPGLNRIFHILIGAAALAAICCLWQHFTGVNLLTGASLQSAPVGDRAYFIPTGFFESPEVIGTLLAMILPIPAAAFLLSDRRGGNWKRYLAFPLIFLLELGVFWTYRPGLWIAAVAGLCVTILMRGRQIFFLICSTAAFFVVVIFASYGFQPDTVFTQIQKVEEHRTETQRAQINQQVQIWQENMWIGAGHKAVMLPTYDPGSGNIYFQILAQTGIFGAAFYLLVILGFLLGTYRIFQEIPSTHYWHRVLVSGVLGAQVSFHLAGLYWSTLAESAVTVLLVLLLSSVAYLTEHYGRGLVSDDYSI